MPPIVLESWRVNDGHTLAMELSSVARQVVGTIDHAILQPSLSSQEIDRELRLVADLPLASVCVRPFFVDIAVDVLKDSKIPVGVVVGFPHGGELAESKADEARRALELGAVDVDVVVNVSKVLSGDWREVEDEIKLVNQVTHAGGGILKVIFENAYLGDDDKIELCQVCSKLGVDFVKTSTGFAYLKNADGSFRTSGATVEDVRLMRQHTMPNVGVKASGGIRTLADFKRMVEAGANRIGTGATLSILAEVGS